MDLDLFSCFAEVASGKTATSMYHEINKADQGLVLFLSWILTDNMEVQNKRRPDYQCFVSWSWSHGFGSVYLFHILQMEYCLEHFTQDYFLAAILYEFSLLLFVLFFLGKC